MKTFNFDKAFAKAEKAFDKMGEAFKEIGNAFESVESIDSLETDDVKITVADGNISITGKIKSLVVNGKKVSFEKA